MSYENIRLEIANGIARLTLHRPDKLNSFTEAMHAELRDALDRIQQQSGDGAARVLVITGAGRAFCAGQDLADRGAQLEAGGAQPNLGETVERNYKPLVMRLANLRVPTLAAVNGVAAGAGASLALACDMAIAARSAYFMLAFAKVGLLPDTGGTWFLPQRIGMARALALAFLAEKLPAEKAAEWGLIWQCVPDEEFATTIDDMAALLASAPTKALVRTRQAMQTAPTHTLEQQLTLEACFMRELGASADYAEGVRAFLAKRPPRFRGE